MNDITALAQGKSLRKKLNRRMNDALGFRRTSGGKHNTISLSIDECKSVIAALDERLALVEALEAAEKRGADMEVACELYAESKLAQIKLEAALEKAQRYIERLREWNADLAQESCEYQNRIAELESRTVTVKLPPRVDSSNVPFTAHTWNCCLDAVEKCLGAAGIQVIEGEQKNG
ncbi:hypothetical protein [Kluyvera intermedia]|uniref:hypothetical protein n=1 Tax=Kluyvera intermedia TaxID=61648 RepID=UPI0039F5D193